ncbi:MAG TPA: 4-aminobutyrate--2-oxoglutarate transaminase [Acidobacteriota bacterium]
MGATRILGAVPGPKSQTWMARRQQAVPRGPYHATPIFAARAQGALLEDVDGNIFLDFAGGIGCLNVGHRAPEVLAAIQHQLQRFLHTCFHVAPYDVYIELAERLNRLAPGPSPKRTLLVNSGAEGIENAVKIARAATGRPGVVCFEDGFHGRTLLTLSLTSKVVPYKAGFGPYVPSIHRLPYGYCYRCAYDKTYPECALHCADRLENLFAREVDPGSVAAVVAEPVLGEGGFVVPPSDWLGRIQAICRRHGILLIADEVQTGFGRTGKLFAVEHAGIEPDLLVCAKSIAGGLPLAAVIGRAELMDAPGVGGLGGTFGGNPVSCAAALAVLDLLEPPELLAGAARIGQRFAARAAAWKERFNRLGDARGLGAMWALELVRDRSSRAPDKEATAKVHRAALERGLLLITAGTFGNVIRTLMPLSIPPEQLEEGLDILEAALDAGLA